ncbi:hypothetical protein JOM56_005640 [Amanita muscaria]
MSVSNDGTYNIFNRANKVYLFIEKDLKASPHPDPAGGNTFLPWCPHPTFPTLMQTSETYRNFLLNHWTKKTNECTIQMAQPAAVVTLLQRISPDEWEVAFQTFEDTSPDNLWEFIPA